MKYWLRTAVSAVLAAAAVLAIAVVLMMAAESAGWLR